MSSALSFEDPSVLSFYQKQSIFEALDSPRLTQNLEPWLRFLSQVPAALRVSSGVGSPHEADASTIPIRQASAKTLISLNGSKAPTVPTEHYYLSPRVCPCGSGFDRMVIAGHSETCLRDTCAMCMTPATPQPCPEPSPRARITTAGVCVDANPHQKFCVVGNPCYTSNVGDVSDDTSHHESSCSQSHRGPPNACMSDRISKSLQRHDDCCAGPCLNNGSIPHLNGCCSSLSTLDLLGLPSLRLPALGTVTAPIIPIEPQSHANNVVSEHLALLKPSIARKPSRAHQGGINSMQVRTLQLADPSFGDDNCYSSSLIQPWRFIIAIIAVGVFAMCVAGILQL